MMERLQVYADFDWLDAPVLVGTLSHEMLRGTPSYGFSFDADACEDYMIDQKEAGTIISEIKQGLRNWRRIATQCQIPKSEQERFAQRIERAII